MASNRLGVALASAASLLISGGAGADPVERRIVALSGTDGPLGPGLGPGVTFGNLNASLPLIDEQGSVAFRGILDGVPTNQRSGYFHERNGALTVVVRAGDPAPQFAPNSSLKGLGYASWNLSADGLIAFTCDVGVNGVPSTEDRLCLWAERADGLHLVCQELGLAPGAPDGYVFVNRDFEIATTTNDGAVSFGTTVYHPSLPAITGVWSYRDGSLAGMAVANTPAYEEGTTYRAIWAPYPYTWPGASPNGAVVFNASVNREGLPPVSMAFSSLNGSPVPILEEDAQAPGLPNGVLIDRLLSPPTLTDSGLVAIEALSFDPAAPATSPRGIWSNRSGSLRPEILTGAPVPGAEPPVEFSNINRSALNARGDIAFRGRVAADGEAGFWLTPTNGGLVPVHIFGAQAPGCPPGFALHDDSSGPFLNNARRIAFHATYADFDPPTSGADYGYSNGAVFAADERGRTVMLFRTGQPLEVEHGDIRWIENIGFFADGLSPDAGMRQTFNDLSMFTCRLRFTDGAYAVVVGQPVSFCSADTNGDGFVDFADLNEVLGAFNSVVLGPAYDFDADLDFDGAVGFADLNLVLSQLGDDCGG